MEPGNPMLDDQVLPLAATPSCLSRRAAARECSAARLPISRAVGSTLKLSQCRILYWCRII